MMDVGIVRVDVMQRIVDVDVGVRLGRVLPRRMRVAMVGVMHVGMLVRERRMHVPVLVVLGQVQPDTDRHQDAGRDQRHGDRCAQGDGECGAD